MKFISFFQTKNIDNLYFFFQKSIQHIDFKNHIDRQANLATAGFFYLDKQIKTFGESVSCNINSVSEIDNEMLSEVKTFHYLVLDQFKYTYDPIIIIPFESKNGVIISKEEVSQLFRNIEKQGICTIENNLFKTKDDINLNKIFRG